MGTVTTTLRQKAESIFSDLGYTVTADGTEIRAERKWRVVEITPTSEPTEVPSSGTLRCFVTWADRMERLERRLRDVDPDYEWAIIGVDGDEYVVGRKPS